VLLGGLKDFEVAISLCEGKRTRGDFRTSEVRHARRLSRLPNESNQITFVCQTRDLTSRKRKIK